MSEITAPQAKDGPRETPFAEAVGRAWYQTRYFWRVSLTFFVIGAVILLAGWFIWHQAEATRRDNATTRQLIVDSEAQMTSLLRWYETAIQSAKLSAMHPSVRGFREDQVAARDYFKQLSSVIKRFSQIRILSPEGMEMLRVDSRHDRVFVVPKGQYQNKAGRYYFEASRQLGPGQVYISRLDLNVEHGRIEIPIRPTSRLITPIMSDRNELIGYFTINLDMAEGLAGFVQDPGSAVERELLNRDGYWLAGPADEFLWGFMRDEETTLAAQDPELWDLIKSTNVRDSLTYDGMIYSVVVFSIADLADASGQELVLPDQPKLFVVSKAPRYDFLLSLQFNDLLTLAGVLLLIAGVSALIGYFVVRRQQAIDIQHRIEANLVSVQRMASLGRIVAGVAHEMRTPLGNALTVSTTIIHDLDDIMVKFAKDSGHHLEQDEIDHVLRGVRIIQKNIERTSALVRNFRETATDQSNHVRRKFDLVKVARNLIGTLEAQLGKKGITLSLTGPATAPLESFSDAVDQVLLSLITNAVQHAFVGRETGRVDLLVVDYDEQFYQVVVSDDGVGIDPKDHQRVFEPFWTSDLPDRGTGLGLAIVSNIVVGVLGGEITLQSEPGLGSSFLVMIPKAAPIRDAVNPYIVTDESQTRLVALGKGRSKQTG